MNDYQLHQFMTRGIDQSQPQTIDPSQLGGEPLLSSYTAQDSTAISQRHEQPRRPSPSDTDYSEGTTLSPTPNDRDETLSTGYHPGVRRENVNDLGKDPRKQKRGRQTGLGKQKRQVAADKQANAPPSKASIKRAELIAMHGAHMIGSDEELKGETRIRADGFLEWKEPGTGNWLPAAPHSLFRRDFINIDIADLPYDNPPEEGLHELDITSNCSVLGQNTWGFERQGWDNIMDGEGNKVMYLEKAPIRSQEFPQGKYWRYRGLIMLDPDDRPVLDWTCIPMTFSSKLEGGRMEALKRVFPWLRNVDFRARMPRMVIDSRVVLVSLPKYSTFGQRLSRFRDRLGCVPWTERAGTADRKKRKLREVSEDAGDGEQVSMDGKSLHSASVGNDSTMKEHDPMSGDNDSRGHPLKRRQNMRGIPFSPSLNYVQGNGQTTHLNPPLTYDATIYPSPDSSTQPGAPPYYQSWAIASSNLPFQQSNLTDLRFVKPQTTADNLNIKTALHITRADFRSRYDFDAPTTPNGESYFTQYQIIQAKHAELWVIDDSPPSLIGIDNWCGSFETFPKPHLSQEDLQ